MPEDEPDTPTDAGTKLDPTHELLGGLLSQAVTQQLETIKIVLYVIVIGGFLNLVFVGGLSGWNLALEYGYLKGTVRPGDTPELEDEVSP